MGHSKTSIAHLTDRSGCVRMLQRGCPPINDTLFISHATRERQDARLPLAAAGTRLVKRRVRLATRPHCQVPLWELRKAQNQIKYFCCNPRCHLCFFWRQKGGHSLARLRPSAPFSSHLRFHCCDIHQMKALEMKL